MFLKCLFILLMYNYCKEWRLRPVYVPKISFPILALMKKGLQMKLYIWSVFVLSRTVFRYVLIIATLFISFRIAKNSGIIFPVY